MIAFLDGILVESLPTQVVIDVHGVGYQVFIPLSSFDRLPAPGERVKLLTRLVVREDAHVLYGFATSDERDLFDLLLSQVSGVGPKLALAILGGMGVEHFKAAVVDGNLGLISKIRGVGKKTAERLVFELKDKLGVAGEWAITGVKGSFSEEDFAIHDAILGLITLGYARGAAEKAVKEALAEEGKDNKLADSSGLVRSALQRLGS